jgi:hypothetical protein
MILEDADEIISKSYKRLGELGFKRARNHDNGFSKSANQKQLYLQARIIEVNLGCVLDHVILDEDGNIATTIRITDEQLNRFLGTLQVFAETDKYATAPVLFHKVKPYIINEGRDAENVIFQWSEDGSDWHSVALPDDQYFRTSVDGGVSWSTPVLFRDITTFVQKAGDTMTGNLTVPDGTDTGHAVNKGQLDTAEASAKSYADGLVVGLWDDRGNYNPATNSNLYPSSGGSGSAGAVKKGDIWTINGLGVGVTTTMGTKTVQDGDTVRALSDTPGQTEASWTIAESNIGYAPENAANKTGTVSGNESSTVLYATIKGFVDWLKQGFTSALSTKAAPIDADGVVVNDSADSNKTKLTTWANIKATLKIYFDPLYDFVAVVHGAASKSTPVDADELGIWDSVANAIKKLTWENLKATLKTYFDGLYHRPSDGIQLLSKVVNIGTWNMDTAPSKDVPHGLDYKKIRSVFAVIRDDADSQYIPLLTDYSSGGGISGSVKEWDATNVVLQRAASSVFDDPAFNNTTGSYNRGYLTIFYAA